MINDAVDAVLQQAVDTGAVPNVVATAADRNGPLYEGAAGPRVAGGDEPVSADTHYRIMSMTKMVATAAALQQVEQGRLDLDAPVEQYCPEFGALQVLDGFDGERPVLRSPRTKATVKQLITHTSGLGYWFWNADLLRWETATGTPNVLSGSNVIFAAPLLADPGTRFQYGINTDWLGKVVEATSGTTFDVAIKEGITGPLGMHETTFWPSADHRKRLVPIHVRGEDGSWVPSEIELRCWATGRSRAPASCRKRRCERRSPIRSATSTSR
jgi:methyl acetate hydrolase